MTPQERQSLEEFLGQLTQVRGTVKDPEAAALIARAAAENPDALYLTVQRAILLEQALNAAKAQITQLQTQSGAGASSGFLTSHWGHAPEQPTRPAAPAASQPSIFGGGSFLGNVASTAAGVAAGAFLFQGIESLFSHHGGRASIRLQTKARSAIPISRTTVFRTPIRIGCEGSRVPVALALGRAGPERAHSYWKERGGGYAVLKLMAVKTGSKPFCWTVTGEQPLS